MNPNRLDELSRRDFLSRTARTCFGLTIGGSMARLFDSTAFAADPAVVKAGGGKAKHVIYLYMSGGMTHIDTFDPKPDAPADSAARSPRSRPRPTASSSATACRSSPSTPTRSR
jgi:hypothetical protein